MDLSEIDNFGVTEIKRSDRAVERVGLGFVVLLSELPVVGTVISVVINLRVFRCSYFNLSRRVYFRDLNELDVISSGKQVRDGSLRC